ncbi:MAG: response regulator [bacterium]
MPDMKTILVVDDEPDILRWLTLLFENNGYRVVTAKDGLEGMEKARSEKPDLITLDISMPTESGVKMYRNLNNDENLNGIPVVLVTGATPMLNTFLSKIKKLKKPAGFMEKPVKDTDLLEKVKEIIG